MKSNEAKYLPYKQGVTGSNPVSPTTEKEGVRSLGSGSFYYWVEGGFEYFYSIEIQVSSNYWQIGLFIVPGY